MFIFKYFFDKIYIKKYRNSEEFKNSCNIIKHKSKVLILISVALFLQNFCYSQTKEDWNHGNNNSIFYKWLENFTNQSNYKLKLPSHTTQNLSKFPVSFNDPYIQPSLSLELRLTCRQCACGIPNKRQRIIGGGNVIEYRLPWMAMLLYLNEFYCGGTLISNFHVLTAAHCLKNLDQKLIKVKLLTNNRFNDNPYSVTRKIATAIIHPNFNNVTFNNDIAILKLLRSVSINGLMRPICLPKPSESFEGYIGIVTGWGLINENGTLAFNLQKLNIPIISKEECLNSSLPAETITNKMLCAGGLKGKDACKGDSGGPLQVLQASQYKLAGIVSWGDGCAKENVPGVYTKVSSFISWIKKNTLSGCYC